ncbi:hypothetical protein AYX14_07107 [Cryptococcus neoformans]|nr:hypothetical protein AYX14_07107 [Cryptococcus neoformans var. grubii]
MDRENAPTSLHEKGSEQ